MKLPTLSLLVFVGLALSAPAAEPEAAAQPAPLLQPRQSCNIASDACYISCRGGSAYLNCADSYCKASGNAGPYGTCVCKCHYG